MHIPRYWAKGSYNGLNCWGWSDESASDAQTRGAENAQKISRLLHNTDRDRSRPLTRYAYGDRPLREEVLEEIKAEGRGDNAPCAIITRNHTGTEVLNTAHVMFLDIDFKKPKQPSFLAKLFRKKVPPDPLIAALAAIEQWLARNPSWGMRIYRTCGGLRAIVTHDLFDPASSFTSDTFEALNVDPLYRRLCKTQNSFRARLTPKPWRCGTDQLHVQWPWKDAIVEQDFKKWKAKYDTATQRFATCHLLKTIGPFPQNDTIHRIVALHDTATRSETTLPLA
jgi:hypothetical protein